MRSELLLEFSYLWLTVMVTRWFWEDGYALFVYYQKDIIQFGIYTRMGLEEALTKVAMDLLGKG